MQWDETEHAGFSTVTPWLPISERAHVDNVAAQRREQTSMHQLYRRLIYLRKECHALQTGNYRPIGTVGDLLLYVRQYEHHRILIALNLGPEPTQVSFTAGLLRNDLVASTLNDRDEEAFDGALDLRGHEGVMVKLADEAVLPT